MKQINNIVVQVSEEQHLSEERFVVNYTEDNEQKYKIVNKSSLTQSELDVYNAFINLANSKI